MCYVLCHVGYVYTTIRSNEEDYCTTTLLQYHINCLGIEPSEIEGMEKWSCPVCMRKRKLQLSPPKSPRKRHKNDSPDGNPSSPAFEEVIAKIARENQIPQL